MAARGAEGDDEDEAMAGVENISAQHAEGGCGSIGGIKKNKPQRRSKGAKNHIKQRQLAEQHARRGSAMHGGSILPFGV